MDINYQAQEDIKKYIRVFFYYANTNKLIKTDRKDGYGTSIELGYEDLSLKEDEIRLSLYQTSQFIELNDITYEVEKRVFRPTVPVCLYLYLNKIN